MIMQPPTLACPCHSQQPYTHCCGPIISGQTQAATPEALMRARYTAFTHANLEYIFSSMTPELASQMDREEMQAFVTGVTAWLGLEITHFPPLTMAETTGIVEFIARFTYQGKKQSIHERSIFVKIEGQWLYAGHEHQCGSDAHNPRPQRSTAKSKTTAVKIGRNDLCPCGSGKKYKKCCGK